MGFIFALLLIGLPLAAAYIDMMQAQGATKLWGFDLPKTGGYTPRWDRTSPAAPAGPTFSRNVPKPTAMAEARPSPSSMPATRQPASIPAMPPGSTASTAPAADAPAKPPEPGPVARKPTEEPPVP
ncbi:MAG TPA: hypothetical protein VH414_08580 [Lichenihabitans sp.]|jgi:hypothetical protein|nr:hypothetical protein [Lichenihabitans sp.]